VTHFPVINILPVIKVSCVLHFVHIFVIQDCLADFTTITVLKHNLADVIRK